MKDKYYINEVNHKKLMSKIPRELSLFNFQWLELRQIFIIPLTLCSSRLGPSDNPPLKPLTLAFTPWLRGGVSPEPLHKRAYA